MCRTVVIGYQLCQNLKKILWPKWSIILFEGPKLPFKKKVVNAGRNGRPKWLAEMVRQKKTLRNLFIDGLKLFMGAQMFHFFQYKNLKKFIIKSKILYSN